MVRLLFSLPPSIFEDTVKGDISRGAGFLEGWLPVSLKVMSGPIIASHTTLSLTYKMSFDMYIIGGF